MRVEGASAIESERRTPEGFRRLFFAHVVAVILTASIVAPLLVSFGSVPSWLTIVCGVLIVAVAAVFVAAGVRAMHCNHQMTVADRGRCVMMTFGLAALQTSFVLPLFICLFFPGFRS